MCLIVLGHRIAGRTPVLLAANRDEFHARPAREAHWWPDAHGILAGRDLEAGGTWLGLHRSGRFAAVTNIPDDAPPATGLESRGGLVAGFLRGHDAPLNYLQSIDPGAYAGFNLLLGDRQSLGYFSNRGGGPRELAPGFYGLSNTTIDTPWDKVERSRKKLERLVAEGRADDSSLLELLRDTEPGSTRAPFVISPGYGTRCSTILRHEASGRWHFLERRFDPDGNPAGESRFSFAGAEDSE